MLENTRRPTVMEEWDAEKETLASPVASVAPKNIVGSVVDQSDKVRPTTQQSTGKANCSGRTCVYYLR